MKRNKKKENGKHEKNKTYKKKRQWKDKMKKTSKNMANTKMKQMEIGTPEDRTQEKKGPDTCLIFECFLLWEIDFESLGRLKNNNNGQKGNRKGRTKKWVQERNDNHENELFEKLKHDIKIETKKRNERNKEKWKIEKQRTKKTNLETDLKRNEKWKKGKDEKRNDEQHEENDQNEKKREEEQNEMKNKNKWKKEMGKGELAGRHGNAALAGFSKCREQRPSRLQFKLTVHCC